MSPSPAHWDTSRLARGPFVHAFPDCPEIYFLTDRRNPTPVNFEFFGPLELVDVPALEAACKDRWYNQTLCEVNESVVRVGVLQGEYHWHHHEREDEFFFVVSGCFLIDLEDRTVDLAPGQGFVVSKGLRHRPRAPEKTVVLMVETAGIVPTGS